MKSNSKSALEEELDKLPEYKKRLYKIARLPKKEQWHVYGPPDWIYEIVINKDVKPLVCKDIVCPKCKGLIEDVEFSKNLYCPSCDIEWRV